MIRTTGAEQQRRQIGRTVSSRDAQEVYVVVFLSLDSITTVFSILCLYMLCAGLAPNLLDLLNLHPTY